MDIKESVEIKESRYKSVDINAWMLKKVSIKESVDTEESGYQ